MERKFERGVQDAGMAPVLPGDLLPRPFGEIREQAPRHDAAPGVAVVVGQMDLRAVGRFNDPASDDGPTLHRRRTLDLLARRRNSVVLLLLLAACSTGTTGTDAPAIDQSTCSIGRDIAADFNVTDTVSRSQERIADLYNGWGEAASPAIASAVRDWSAGMTSGDTDLAIKGIRAFDAACTAEGL